MFRLSGNPVYVEIPKKQGKSELAAAVALLLTCGDGEEREEIQRLHPGIPGALGHDIKQLPVRLRDKVEAACESAKQNPGEENSFRQLRLNQWVKQAVRWMPMDKWDACASTFPSVVISFPCRSHTS